MTPSELKRINTEISDLGLERTATMKTIATLQRDVVAIDAKIKARKATIESASRKEIIVSEHVLLRYFERVEGRDIGLISTVLLPEHVKRQIDTIGSGTFPVEIDNEEYELVVKNRTVITIT